jgi:hypothetical protein
MFEPSTIGIFSQNWAMESINLDKPEEATGVNLDDHHLGCRTSH